MKLFLKLLFYFTFILSGNLAKAESCPELLSENQSLFQVLLTRIEFSEAMSEVRETYKAEARKLHVGVVRVSEQNKDETLIYVEIRSFHYADTEGNRIIGHMLFSLPNSFGGIGNFEYRGFVVEPNVSFEKVLKDEGNVSESN